MWMIATSLKSPEEVFTPQMCLLPRHWRPSNYCDVFAVGSFPGYILNSFIVTAAGTLLECGIAFMGAYALARLNSIGKKALFLLIIGTLMIPPHILMLPSYIIISRLRLLDTYLGLILPRAGAAFGIFLLRQHMLTIPNDIADAAEIDGTGLGDMMLKIYLPLSFPVLVTVGVFSMIGFWNDYYWPLIITSRSEMRTLALGISHFKSLEGMGQWELLMAAATIATLPMLLIFFLSRKTVIENMTTGSVKG